MSRFNFKIFGSKFSLNLLPERSKINQMHWKEKLSNLLVPKEAWLTS